MECVANNIYACRFYMWNKSFSSLFCLQLTFAVDDSEYFSHHILIGRDHNSLMENWLWLAALSRPLKLSVQVEPLPQWHLHIHISLAYNNLHYKIIAHTCKLSDRILMFKHAKPPPSFRFIAKKKVLVTDSVVFIQNFCRLHIHYVTFHSTNYLSSFLFRPPAAGGSHELVPKVFLWTPLHDERLSQYSTLQLPLST